jgi:hypothetical protein
VSKSAVYREVRATRRTSKRHTATPRGLTLAFDALLSKLAGASGELGRSRRRSRR